MGGSVAVHVAAKKVLPNLCGLVVVDVVEVYLSTKFMEIECKIKAACNINLFQFQGTAIASLIHMQKILSSRMQHFSSIEKAVTNSCISCFICVVGMLKLVNCYPYSTSIKSVYAYFSYTEKAVADS